MKKLMTIFGAFFFASFVLTSCGDVNVEDLDEDIKNKEDAVEALITIKKAEIEMIDKAMGPMQELADMKDRGDDISDASKDVWDKINEKDWSDEALAKEDNWDEYEDLTDELEDKVENFMKLYEEQFKERIKDEDLAEELQDLME